MLNTPQNLSSDAAEISKYFENCFHSFGCKKLTHMQIFVSFSFILREKFFLLEIQTLNKLAIFSHSALRHFIETTECLRYWSVKLNSRIYANSPSTQEQWSYFQDHGTEWCYGKTVRNFRPTHDDRQSSPLETIPFLKERKEEKSKEPYW